ncbi:hypothetical protein P43SY_001064 [Pythium insidiosum]|uniref:Uncharacterized protein n=1 Tax=Pythium insidiosum TaxID=114742 RepID=A0AAD5QCV0_PYTIN|nr:hypothetical protein P43SY_001064 [Pythium insidiosum]KAJ0410696.1 hypothetical protein ATCC90586_008281 [Pythium insidiosum]
MTSMLSAPLPTCAEYDPLDDTFEELEGLNLLQDAVLRPVADGLANLTPLSSTNGYTSEESDCAVATPSEEQMYSHMTFLRQDSNELFEEVADFVEDNDLTSLTPQQQQVFAGKMIKGKTSKYRGVTQTSKTSWGAKYSAKRITNTCKTPDEAARAYDEYLKTNHPEKYAKFANFCTRCDRFVNPLGLSEFKNECVCESLSDHGSTEAESPPHSSETDDEIEQLDSSEKMEIREGSNLSISSLKLSFLDDGPIFDDSLLPGDFTMDSALNGQDSGQYLDRDEIKHLQAVSTVGAIDSFGVLPDGSGVQLEVTFFPDVWKFEFDLPKKRRLTSATGTDGDADGASAEFLYFFEMDIFYPTETMTFQRLGHAESMSFQIGNTRTLLRQRNRMAEDTVDRVLGNEAMPEKKKVKMYLGQRGARDSSILEGDEELEGIVGITAEHCGVNRSGVS